jgi:peptidoglycan/LPS O-acetylase OafA/YrhL
MHLKYRPEIDGLRAIAVIAVLIYHANFLISGKQFLSGGYLGVDVFFVISGYLITLILLKEMQANSFSYVSFYERRARRILPALFVILTISTFAAWFLLSPLLFKNYSGSLSSTAVFGSNFFFWNDTGYNAEASEYKPLLHTWSLAVEEQFYIVFPLILFIVWRYVAQYLLAVLTGIFVISLAYASWINQEDANSAFYLITARAWQLMAGALLAHFEFSHGRDQSPLLGILAPVIGLLMILGSLFLFNQTTSHPGFLTLIPVAGTMMIIRYTQPSGYFFKILGNRGLTSIGLISYSLYLWHIPVFSFERIKSQTEATPLDKLDWIGLSILLATITFWLVEKPFRNKQRIHTGTIWIGSGVGISVFMAFGLYGYYSEGIPARLPSFIGKIAVAEQISSLPYGDHGAICGPRDFSSGNCRFTGGNDSLYTLVTVGDSHIGSLHKPIHDRISALAAFMPLTKGRCLFVLDLERISGKARMCETEFNQKRLAKILEQKNPLVVTGGRLPLQIESSRFNNQEGGIEPGNDHPTLVKPGAKADRPANMDSIKQAFSATAKQLLENNVKLVLVYPIPEVGWHVPRKLTSMVRGKQFHELVTLNSRSPLTTSHAVFKERTRRSYEVYDNIPDHENLLRIYPEKLLCRNGRCHTHSDNTIYYRDDDHLSYDGADMLVTHIFEEVEKKWGMNTHNPPT